MLESDNAVTTSFFQRVIPTVDVLAVGGPVFAAPWRTGSPDPGGPYFVSHTVFTYHHIADLPAIGLEAARAAEIWSDFPGALWLRQWIQPTKRFMGDLSIWRSEQDLRDFLTSKPHQALVADWRTRMDGVHVSWTVASVDFDSLWTDALDTTASTDAVVRR